MKAYHLARKPLYSKAVCGNKVNPLSLTTNPHQVSCQSCIRCMNKREVRLFLGDIQEIAHRIHQIP